MLFNDDTGREPFNIPQPVVTNAMTWLHVIAHMLPKPSRPCFTPRVSCIRGRPTKEWPKDCDPKDINSTGSLVRVDYNSEVTGRHVILTFHNAKGCGYYFFNDAPPGRVDMFQSGTDEPQYVISLLLRMIGEVTT